MYTFPTLELFVSSEPSGANLRSLGPVHRLAFTVSDGLGVNTVSGF